MTLEDSVREIFLRMISKRGWQEVFSRHGVSSETSLGEDIRIDRSLEGFGDFCLDRSSLIVAADPAASLLYHCLASPAVRPGGLSPEEYPTSEEIDLVEDYIYSLNRFDADFVKTLVPAVFAYEYREAAAVPHQRHADLVFSRTGISRIGNAPSCYDPVTRSYRHEGAAPHEVRAMAVRYAAFLCRRVKGSEIGDQLQGKKQRGDEDRFFLVPVIKLFKGLKSGQLKVGNVSLSAFHFTDRLRRLFTIGKLKSATEQDLSRPPFVRSSRNGGLILDVRITGSSLVLAPAAQPLVRELTISAGNSTGSVRRGVAMVPPDRLPNPVYSPGRRYSTLRLGQKLLTAGIDYVGSEVSEYVAKERLFLSPRNCAEFVNIRHRVNLEDGSMEDMNWSIEDDADFAATLKEGDYPFALFMDDISDGYVSATFEKEPSEGEAVAVYECAASFSVITAPDFFPFVGAREIRKFAGYFTRGGPSPLSEGRLRANSMLRDPETGAEIFSEDDSIVAMVSALPRTDLPKSELRQVEVTNMLTDGASNVFAPGWDVTYGRNSIFSEPYYHTAGLGAPFVEDAKLCAAANGMWAAASPDASRTFSRSDSPTALPLTDEEIGYHPASPAARSLGSGMPGWDGEYGPYLTESGGEFGVNYANIARSDYVTNALRNLLRFDKLRRLTPSLISDRMTALGAAIEALDGLPGDVAKTKQWLIVFREIADWADLDSASILPASMLAAYPGLGVSAGKWQGCSGLLFGFVPFPKPRSGVATPDHRLFSPLSTQTAPVFVMWRGLDYGVEIVRMAEIG